MERFRNKYRIPSARLPRWNYGSAALYFITICTQHRICWFGNMVDAGDTMGNVAIGENAGYRTVETPCMASLPPSPPNRIVQLSAIGEIVASEWIKTFQLRPDMNLYQGEYVVMPNHFHAIIGIGENAYNAERRRDAMDGVSTAVTTTAANQFGPQSKNLASIMRGFKSAVTVAARCIDPHFKWQERFYDRIIRNEDAHRRIAVYINNNPAHWQDDKFFIA